MLDWSQYLPSVGGTSDWLAGLSPFVVWLAPVLLIMAGIAILPTLAAGLGSMLGPDLDKRAAGAWSEGYEQGYIEEARSVGEDVGRGMYVGASWDNPDFPGEEEVE
jgi:hypothetical protein